MFGPRLICIYLIDILLYNIKYIVTDTSYKVLFLFLQVHLNILLRWNSHLLFLTGRLLSVVFAIRKKSQDKRQQAALIVYIISTYFSVSLQFVEIPRKCSVCTNFLRQSEVFKTITSLRLYFITILIYFTHKIILRK